MTSQALNRRNDKIVSYCIPVLNRRDELLTTLSRNLEENRQFARVIEFIVLIYDHNSALFDHLMRAFASDIESDYLVVVRSNSLTHWHFGRAKNGFKPIMKGSLYSSLDADNFVTKQETSLLLRLYDVHAENFIHFGFSGNWGDGTSGRVTTGARYYLEIGYDEFFMPRQFDEYDLALSILRKHPRIPILFYSSANVTLLRGAMFRFMQRESWNPKIIVLSRPAFYAPLNPKGVDYVKHNPSIKYMQEYNQSVSFAKNAASREGRNRYYQSAWDAANKLVDALTPAELMEIFYNISLVNAAKRGSGVKIFSCLRNEGDLLSEWVGHHRRIGCSAFYLISDGSTEDIPAVESRADLNWFVPSVGTFRTCKSAWIRALMKVYAVEAEWVLTIDGDEYIEIPSSMASSLPALARKMETRDKWFVAGLLIDMLPSSTWLSAPSNFTGRQILEIFDNHLWELPNDSNAYRSAAPVRWGFGKFWRLSAMVDARYKLFQTFDSLRKIPFFRYERDIVLNQGFHDLKRGGRGLAADEVWDGKCIAIKHYKLAKVLTTAGRNDFSSSVSKESYHARTGSNMNLMLDIEMQELRQNMLKLTTVTFDSSRVLRRPRGKLAHIARAFSRWFGSQSYPTL